MPPNGVSAARSGSTWIHWRSPVASANALISPWVTSSQVARAEFLADVRLEFVDAVDRQLSHVSDPQHVGLRRAYARLMPTADDERRVLEQVQTKLYIDGQWLDGGGGRLTVEDPATGESLVDVADADAADADAALAAADRAFATWKHTAPRERGDILRRANELMIERKDDLALLMTLEMGKPVTESAGEIVYAANFLRWYAEEAVRITGGSPRTRTARPRPDDAAAGRALPVHHAVELPARDGDPQDRPGARRRLHAAS